MILDFHNHYFPPGYVEEIRTGPSNFRVTEDEEGNPVLHSPGDYNVLVPGHRDLAHRMEELDRAGVDRQVLTLTAPGTSVEEPARAVELARLANDGLVSATREHPERFTALAHLPLTVPEAAANEAERILAEGSLRGFMLYSNAGGVSLADPRFWPLYEVAQAHEAVMYIHPTYPVGVEAMRDYMLMPLVGFLFDTTLAAAHLVYAGIPERFPGHADPTLREMRLRGLGVGAGDLGPERRRLWAGLPQGGRQGDRPGGGGRDHPLRDRRRLRRRRDGEEAG